MEPRFSAEIEERIRLVRATGRYESDTAVVLAALDLLVEFESLRDEINKGLAELDAGVGIPSEVVFAELRAHAAEVAARHAAERQRRFRESLESTIERYGEVLRRLADQ
ncbi:MAG TPA: hypothetical protein VML55_19525 [Planctomycetaceae bacterium]|nr:hypothetical protein [Planctomycetaceae bacterium]